MAARSANRGHSWLRSLLGTVGHLPTIVMLSTAGHLPTIVVFGWKVAVVGSINSSLVNHSKGRKRKRKEEREDRNALGGPDPIDDS